MPYQDPGGRSRWHRLWPKDLADGALLLVASFGLLLGLAAAAGLDGSEFGVIGLFLGPLLVLHGSSPAFFFVGALVYLLRRGRSIGASRRWVWAGAAMTLPLWFLVGQSVVVRGLGDVSLLLVPWNLLALGVMGVGVWRTLHA